MISKTFLHENWTGFENDGSDIALLLMDNLSENTPVAMALESVSTSNTERVVAIGWGEDESGNSDGDLKEAKNIQIIQNRFCNDEEEGWPFVKDSMICAEGTFSGQNLCRGELL